jgi:prepilin-type N-terminal cleavage/methylation domain-containing protein
MRTLSKRGRRAAFTLIELLVVIAIIAILIALLVPAIQMVRESANRTTCQNNIKQIALAVNTYNTAYKSLPPYFGYGGGWNHNSGAPTSTGHGVYGGYLVHLLPYLEQEPMYQDIVDSIASAGRPTGGGINPTTTGTPTTTSVTTTTVVNGISYTSTGNSTTGTSTTYGSYVWPGIYAPGVSDAHFPWGRCPSDPSAQPDYLASGNSVGFAGWSVTNYLANWNVLGDSYGDSTTQYSPNTDGSRWDRKSQGYYSMPNQMKNITDGTSSTILLAEGYGYCDRTPRITLYNAGYHNFGISPGVSTISVTSGDDTLPAGTSISGYGYGIPNTFSFQVRPKIWAVSQCPKGEDCCSPWQAQTPHVTLNVAMVDASVHAVDGSISSTTWSRVMLPRDGYDVGPDWVP